ncbi:MAG TPA: hypothetical protein VLV28_11260 [Gaiellaceae bacterium]|nr:hypothetical protein [Gaiellaceae bacterium]
MPNTNFDDVLPIGRDGSLTVRGPFDPEGAKIVGDTLIRFIIVQTPQMLGMTVPPGEPVTVPVLEGPAFFKGGKKWSTKVSKTALRRFKIKPGKARAVGIAVLVTRAKETDIPAVNTITWCQDVTIGSARAATATRP